MQIREVEVYGSKQLLAFIEYLKVVAEERKAQEEQQAKYAAMNSPYGAGLALSGSGQLTNYHQFNTVSPAVDQA